MACAMIFLSAGHDYGLAFPYEARQRVPRKLLEGDLWRISRPPAYADRERRLRSAAISCTKHAASIIILPAAFLLLPTMIHALLSSPPRGLLAVKADQENNCTCLTKYRRRRARHILRYLRACRKTRPSKSATRAISLLAQRVEN